MDGMDYLQKIVIDFELQSVAGIKECFEHGLNPNEMLDGKPLIYTLINFYPRGPLFKECIQEFVGHGLEFEDKILLSILLDDADALDALLTAHPKALQKRYSLDCTFTPLYKATLLHICAEYNHVGSAKVLMKHGADVNVKAGIDEHGFGGHTPIFHTVNQNENRCIDMMHYLVAQGADLHLTVKGLIWGKGYEWETFIPAVNPISYAMMGLLRQFQRTEEMIYEVVSVLMKARYGIDYVSLNVPNAYLKG